ncbi:MAG: S-layer homology domain-containing protein [Peptococcaceae bacterium]|nr:S-layer homology domain-containing protein [Peptococcaceae bacterium]
MVKRKLLATVLAASLMVTMAPAAYAEPTDAAPTTDAQTQDEQQATPLTEKMTSLASGNYVLSENVTLTDGTLTVPKDEVVTLDLNGHTLTNAAGQDTITVELGGELTITDSSETKGKIDNVSHGQAAIYNNGTVTLRGGTFDRSKETGINAGTSGGNSYYTILNHGEMTINSGVTVTTHGGIELNEYGRHSALVDNGYYNYTSKPEEKPNPRINYVENTNQPSPKLTINGATLAGGLATIKNDDNGQLFVIDGTIKNYAQEAVFNVNEATITGGTFTTVPSYTYTNGNGETKTQPTFGMRNLGAPGAVNAGKLSIDGGVSISGGDYGIYQAENGKLDFGSEVKISGNPIIKGNVEAVRNASTNTGAVISVTGGQYYTTTESGDDQAFDMSPFIGGTNSNIVQDADGKVFEGKYVTIANVPDGATLTITDKVGTVVEPKNGTYPLANGVEYTLTLTKDGYYNYTQTITNVDKTIKLPDNALTPESTGPAVYAIDVNAGDHGTAVADPHKASRGKVVTIKATPESGYEVDAVSVTDRKGKAVTVTKNSDGTYSFTMPASKVDIKVTFKTAEGNVTPEKPSYDNCDKGGDCPLHAFTDVIPEAWYHDGVHYALDNGLLVGTSATTFSPDAATSRGMLVTILWRMEGEPAADAASFADVADGAYYADAVAWAAANDIVSGYSSERFAPNDAVSREQIACILYRYAQYKGLDVSDLGNYAAYSDAGQVSAYADVPMKWAVGNKLINGTSQITLEPKASADRAQVANILMRYAEDIAK